MHGHRSKFQAQTLRGGRESQGNGLAGGRAAPGLPWASCSLAILCREGLGGSQDSGQQEPDGHTASCLLRNLGSQQQDEGWYEACLGYVLSKKTCGAKGHWGGLWTGQAGCRAGATLSSQPRHLS